MNKEVIYLEPEDDITDILTKLQQAKQKLVALVPPKKTSVLRSAVNMKLVARTAKESDKVAVIVTADPAIVKMAMMAQIPIAKTLQSRPVVPTKEDIDKTMAEEQVIEEDLADASAAAELDGLGAGKHGSKKPAEAFKNAPEKTSKKDGDIMNLDEESLENGSKDGKKGKNKDKKGKDGKKATGFEKYRKWIIFGSIAAVLLIVVGVWAFVFAPAAKITVAMETSSDSFSEEVKFTTDRNAEKLDDINAILYVEKQTLEQRYETDFTATGQEDRGEKAKGNVKASYIFQPTSHKDGFNIDIPAGTELVAKETGKVYKSTAGATITWDGAMPITCANGTVNRQTQNCTLTATIPVEAIGSGEDFNLEKGKVLNDVKGANLTVADAISGGTTKDVTVVSLQDVHAARDQLVQEHAEENKTKLLDQIKKDDDLVMIEPSYAENVEDLTSKPDVGAEVEGSTKPTVSVKISYSVYTVKKSQIEQLIQSKTKIADDQRIYSIGEPYFDRFTSLEEPARLKTTVKIGPTVTEETIIERTKGKKIGEVQSLLRSMNGVSSVNVSPSYFWVRSVPNDPSRITVDLTVEDK